MERGNPNLAQGIIYQKLQMLNCCIEKKIHRDQDQAKRNNSETETISFNQDVESNSSDSRPSSANKTVTGNEEADKEQSESDDNDDEFFECESDAEESRNDLSEDTQTKIDGAEKKSETEPAKNNASSAGDTTDRPDSTSSTSISEDSVLRPPKGRLSKLDDLRLLNDLDDLYVPTTQEPAPMTEDQLAEHAEVLTRFVYFVCCFLST